MLTVSINVVNNFIVIKYSSFRNASSLDTVIRHQEPWAPLCHVEIYQGIIYILYTVLFSPFYIWKRCHKCRIRPETFKNWFFFWLTQQWKNCFKFAQFWICPLTIKEKGAKVKRRRTFPCIFLFRYCLYYTCTYLPVLNRFFAEVRRMFFELPQWWCHQFRRHFQHVSS